MPGTSVLHCRAADTGWSGEGSSSGSRLGFGPESEGSAAVAINRPDEVSIHSHYDLQSHQGNDMFERAPSGRVAFAVGEGLIGGLLLAMGGLSAFLWLSDALSQYRPAAGDEPTGILLGAAGLIGICLLGTAVGLLAGRRWARPLGLAAQFGLIASGVVLGVKSAGLGMILSLAVGLAGVTYLTTSGFSNWPARKTSTPIAPVLNWLRGVFIVAAAVELGVLLGSPMGLLVVGLQAVSGEPGVAPDFGILVLMLIWLASLAGLQLWFWQKAKSWDAARLSGHSIAVVFGLGALLPWAGWVRIVPVVVALALEAALFFRPERGWFGSEPSEA